VERLDGTGEAFALAFVDIDRLGALNDAHGYAQGDRLIKGVTVKLRAATRGQDHLARAGDGTFGLILPATGAVDANRATEALRNAVEMARFNLDGQAVKMTVSAGVAAAKRGEGVVGVTGRADAALRQAKALGRNRIAAAP